LGRGRNSIRGGRRRANVKKTTDTSGPLVMSETLRGTVTKPGR